MFLVIFIDDEELRKNLIEEVLRIPDRNFAVVCDESLARRVVLAFGDVLITDREVSLFSSPELPPVWKISRETAKDVASKLQGEMMVFSGKGEGKTRRLVFDWKSRSVVFNGERRKLSPTEFSILWRLANYERCTKSELVETLQTTSRSIDVLISKMNSYFKGIIVSEGRGGNRVYSLAL